MHFSVGLFEYYRYEEIASHDKEIKLVLYR